MLTFKREDFSGVKLNDSRNILSVFYAEWCPFCTSFLKLFEMITNEKTDPLGALVDISDTNNPLWESFEIEIVPTLIGFRGGEVVVKKDGIAGVGLGRPELEEAIGQMRKG